MVGDYEVREVRVDELDQARSVMLDTFYGELKCGYVPQWHADVIDPAGTYLAEPRHRLLVAVRDGEVVATTAVRAHGPNHPPHPAWLVERYPSGTTAQLFRVYVRSAHRRRGLASALVQAACEFVAVTPGYTGIYLHCNVSVPGAEAFWRSVAREVHDGRPEGSQVVHFEIPIPVITTAGEFGEQGSRLGAATRVAGRD